MSKLKKSINYWEIIFIFLVFFLIVGFKSTGLQTKNENNFAKNLNVFSVKTVSAGEIAPHFQCPCCGKLINDCSCPMAKERMSYVGELIESGESKSKDEIILGYVKEYGLDSFINESDENEYKEKLITNAPISRPIISLSPALIDLGNISESQGVATTIFDLENKGDKDLIINGLETSCGCTSASVIFQNKEGPRFNMPGHGINNEIRPWQVVIAPGEKAQVKVYYDPNVHQGFRGLAVRNIYIASNDPINFKQKITIELNQVN